MFLYTIFNMETRYIFGAYDKKTGLQRNGPKYSTQNDNSPIETGEREKEREEDKERDTE